MDPETLDSDLDVEISSIRAEIRTLQHRRRILTSSLLSSHALQRLSKTHSLPPAPNQSHSHRQQEWIDISPLIQSSATHAETNHHRIAFSTTTFPFSDPSPNAEVTNLLGVRIDICDREGRYTKPYYVLLRRVKGDKKEVKVHRHTVPSVVDMGRLERGYLPVEGSRQEDAEGQGEGEQLKPWKQKTRKQDLKGFVREVRKQLVVWHLRCDAVRYLREELGVVRRGVDDAMYEDDERPWERDILGGGDGAGEETRIAKNKFGIVSLAPTALEAVYVRVEWEDGRVGRFKISSTGVVERAVVIGDAGRDKLTEGVMTGGNGRVETLLKRLGKHIVAGDGSET
ncbi:hypothetical protein BO94DRAFT_569820 [Aspergillus sclerotioniger CBS 115572]|uniref:Cenp-O kinetochore centromere component n=1 Tax=Aspergillus sclerotioniger CBS 115572 TaxID=1450535 RepID=A0A317V8V0_9EURO|nr:hypothetical protein BO94DRAFT_569820 [Aspergillus sclerotioniger CBS 115572]PWY68490.1 hypothetical protein BO94DRAFT_569820 [Aspergillus sclerotioniger CBS 115572]